MDQPYLNFVQLGLGLIIEIRVPIFDQLLIPLDFEHLESSNYLFHPRISMLGCPPYNFKKHTNVSDDGGPIGESGPDDVTTCCDGATCW